MKKTDAATIVISSTIPAVAAVAIGCKSSDTCKEDAPTPVTPSAQERGTMRIITLLVAFASVIIASASWWVAADMRDQTREHYRLMVKPLVATEQVVPLRGPAAVRVHNRGVGPAFITELQVYYRGNTVFDSATMTDWDWATLKKSLRETIPEESVVYEGRAIVGKVALRAGDSMTVFSISSTDTSYMYLRDSPLVKLLGDLRVRISGESLYEEPFLSVFQ